MPTRLSDANSVTVSSTGLACGAPWRTCCNQALRASRRSQAVNAPVARSVCSERQACSNVCCARSSASDGSRHRRRSRLRSHECRRRTISLKAAVSPRIASASTADSAAMPSAVLASVAVTPPIRAHPVAASSPPAADRYRCTAQGCRRRASRTAPAAGAYRQRRTRAQARCRRRS